MDNYNCKKTAGIGRFYQLFEMKNITACFLFMLICTGCGNMHKNSKVAKKDIVPDSGKETVLGKIEGGREGDFITLTDGRILFVYGHFPGDPGDYVHAYLASRYSTDSGKTWSREEIVVSREGKLSGSSVSLLRLRNGVIALFNLKANATDDITPWMCISTDEGKTWSGSKQCVKDRKGFTANKGIGFQLNNNRVIQLEGGRLLMPVAIHRIPTGVWGPESDKGSIWNYYSDDNGETWQISKEVPTPDSIMTQEPGVAELKNGDILMIMRTGAHAQYISYSRDHGETWDPAIRSNITSPRSPASIKRIPSTGDLVLVWNNNGKDQKRTPLNIAISKDEGKSWEKVKKIEDDPGECYCYTAINFVGDYVLLGYGCMSSSKITRVSLNWIYK